MMSDCSSTTSQRFRLVILGSGSTAFAAALRAAELGKTAVMAEERIVGGTCANRGCLPSKNLIEAARIVHESAHPRYPGLTPAKMGLDFRALIKRKDEVVHGYRKRRQRARFSVPFDHGRFDSCGVWFEGEYPWES